MYDFKSVNHISVLEKSVEFDGCCVGVYSNVFCARVRAWVELEQHWVRIIWVEIRDGGEG